MSLYAEDQPQENECVELLARAFNAFCALPRYHTSEIAEFAQAIHVCQGLVMAREAVRKYPDAFNGPQTQTRSKRPPIESVVMRSAREE